MLDLQGMTVRLMLAHMRSPEIQREWRHNLDFNPEGLGRVTRFMMTKLDLFELPFSPNMLEIYLSSRPSPPDLEVQRVFILCCLIMVNDEVTSATHELALNQKVVRIP